MAKNIQKLGESLTFLLTRYTPPYRLSGQLHLDCPVIAVLQIFFAGLSSYTNVQKWSK